MIQELIGGAIMLGVIGICYLGVVWYQAVAECARDSSEFPDQHESDESLTPLSFPQNNGAKQ